MASKREHRVRVTRRANTGVYVMVCTVCGPVGQEQEHLGDAESIARRHEDVQGWER